MSLDFNLSLSLFFYPSFNVAIHMRYGTCAHIVPGLIAQWFSASGRGVTLWSTLALWIWYRESSTETRHLKVYTITILNIIRS